MSDQKDSSINNPSYGQNSIPPPRSVIMIDRPLIKAAFIIQIIYTLLTVLLIIIGAVGTAKSQKFLPVLVVFAIIFLINFGFTFWVHTFLRGKNNGRDPLVLGILALLFANIVTGVLVLIARKNYMMPMGQNYSGSSLGHQQAR